MPFIETSTSRQELDYDIDGRLSLTRTFKVWQVDTNVIYRNPGSIGMPVIGHVYDGTVQGPDGADYPVQTQLRLHHYTVRPISAVMFFAIAHYSNDPRLAPLGVDYISAEQFTVVQIPYVQRVVTIAGGSTKPAYQGATVGLPMATQKIRQTVTVARQLRQVLEDFAKTQVGKIHEPWDGMLARFDGVDGRIHGANYFQATYNWTWESGIDYDLTTGYRIEVANSSGFGPSPTIPALYPNGIKPIDPALGEDEMLLPPFHTIEMMSTADVDGVRIPTWVYRLPYKIEKNGWDSLPGSANFEWVLVPQV